MKSKTQDPNHTTLAGERQLDEYVLEHSDDEPEYLYRLWRATNVHLLHGRMASGRLQGRLLKMFVEMIRPQNILEVGTFSGYSALCMAEGLSSLPKQGGLGWVSLFLPRCRQLPLVTNERKPLPILGGAFGVIFQKQNYLLPSSERRG